MPTCRAKLGRAPKPLPRWAGELLAKLLLRLGPTGLEFGRYSIEYHWSAALHAAMPESESSIM
jgi:hypothetical protein